ncbi:organic cation transporter protein-like [Tubulanus polymorphus]|uniref:organic cation transporter protein-like n=1 Tax=Tubulanus polymorphus TaxID=672921 RepID=UPI003DA215E1
MDKCNMYEYPGQTNRNTTVPCQNGYTYDSDGYYTVVEEFSWVCEKAILTSVSQTTYFGGVLFGSACFPPFADYFGRKYTTVITGILGAISHLVGGIVVQPAAFIFTRFVNGATDQGTYLCGCVMVFECYSTKHRAFANSILMIIWSLGMVATGITGYLVKNWQHFQIFASCLLGSAILGIWYEICQLSSWLGVFP